MTGCKETACTTCAHLKVCKFSKDFLNAQCAVDNVMVHLGEGKTRMLRDFDHIKPITLQCKNYMKKDTEVILR